jgi:hypothetical protein
MPLSGKGAIGTVFHVAHCHPNQVEATTPIAGARRRSRREHDASC